MITGLISCTFDHLNEGDRQLISRALLECDKLIVLMPETVAPDWETPQYHAELIEPAETRTDHIMQYAEELGRGADVTVVCNKDATENMKWAADHFGEYDVVFLDWFGNIDRKVRKMRDEVESGIDKSKLPRIVVLDPVVDENGNPYCSTLYRQELAKEQEDKGDSVS